MADTPFPRFRIRRYVLKGGDEPVPVVAPIACCFLGWRNLADISVSISTPPHDETSFDTLEPQLQGVLIVPMAGPRELAPRFQKDEEVLRLKLNSNNPSDSGVVVVQFVF